MQINIISCNDKRMSLSVIEEYTFVPNKKRAIFIGINYLQSPRNRLYGCANDVKNLSSYIKKKYFDVKILSDDIISTEATIKWPSRTNIMEAINWITEDMNPGDESFFHYSGHGGLTIDLSGDEISGYDSCIYPISEKGSIECITDDELRKMLVEKIPKDAKCTVIFDCCHSGSALDLRYNYEPTSYYTMNVTENINYEKGKGLVIFISGCLDNQVAMDTINKYNIPSGALTNSVLEFISKDYDMKKFLWEILNDLKQKGYAQIPQLSSSIPFHLSWPLLF